MISEPPVKQEDSAYSLASVDLPYPLASEWTTDSIMHYILTHGFSVPGRNTSGKRTYFSAIVSADGTTTLVPSVYRIPLLFVATYLWRSVCLVLRAGEWDAFKLSILHVSRMVASFLGEARAEHRAERGLGKMWRSAMFGRVLVRYRMGWLRSEPERLSEFDHVHGRTEYRNDTVKTLEWAKIVTKGHNGFCVTETQIEDGLTLRELIDGLKEHEGKWLWDAHSPGHDALTLIQQWKASNTWRGGEEPTIGVAVAIPPSAPAPAPAPNPKPTSFTTSAPSPLISTPVSFATPKSGLPLVFTALEQREAHIARLETQVAVLKRKLNSDYDNVYPAHDDVATDVGCWQHRLDLTLGLGHLAKGEDKPDSTPVKSRRKEMDTGL